MRKILRFMTLTRKIFERLRSHHQSFSIAYIFYGPQDPVLQDPWRQDFVSLKIRSWSWSKLKDFHPQHVSNNILLTDQIIRLSECDCTMYIVHIPWCTNHNTWNLCSDLRVKNYIFVKLRNLIIKTGLINKKK